MTLAAVEKNKRTTWFPSRASWFCSGDMNGFFGLLADNVATLSFIAAILVGVFRFPPEIVFKRLVPGTAFSVFLGDTVFSFIGMSLSRKLERNDIAAMPLGLDTPSAIGLAFTVLGPTFIIARNNGIEPCQAALNAWYVGMACVFMIGVLKTAVAPFANTIRRVVPKAALLGSLAGLCVAFIGLMPLVEIFTLPVAGIISFGLILYTLVARIDLPFKLAGAFVAIVAGTIVYHCMGATGLSIGTYAAPTLKLYFGYPMPSIGFIKGFIPMLQYLPVVIPFSILVIIGDLNVTESAVTGGDPYEPKTILLVDGLCTLIGGICGSISQTTAYVGQPAYKDMGSRVGYTLLAGIFIGLGGIFGYISFFVELIPTAILAPILIFVGIEITSQAYTACHARYAPAICLAIFPSIARYLQIQFTNPEYISADRLNELINQVGPKLPPILVTIALSGGFIFVGMLWGGMMVELIDRRLRRATVYSLILAVLSFFGIVHSASISGQMYFPWNLTGNQQTLAYSFSLGYFILSAMIFLLSYTKEAKEFEYRSLGDTACVKD